MKVEKFKKIDSTNEHLLKCPGNDMRACIADQQTKGRGQLGRSWYSPQNTNIYFSMRYPLNNDNKDLSGLSIAIGLLLLDILKPYTKDLKIKWPNDIFYQDKKLAGVLIELNKKFAVIGIGINVNMPHSTDNNIDKPWVSLQQITGKTTDIEPIYTSLIENTPPIIQKFLTEGLNPFLKDLPNQDYLSGKTIQLTNSSQKFIGTACGVDSKGQLLVKLKNGEIKSFASGSPQVV